MMKSKPYRGQRCLCNDRLRVIDQSILTSDKGFCYSRSTDFRYILREFLSVVCFFLLFIPICVARDDASSSPHILAAIVVDEPGIYRVTYQDFESAGIALTNADPRTFNLLNKGLPISTLVYGEEDGRFDPNDYVEFYGTFNRGITTHKDIYSDENVYFLVEMEEEPLRFRRFILPSDVQRYPHTLREGLLYKTVHFEELHELKWNKFDNSGGEPTDFAFWYIMDSWKREFRKKFIIPGLSNGTGSVYTRIKFYGRSDLPVEPDHHVIIKANEKMIGDFTFEGATGYLFESPEFPPELVRNNEIVIHIQLPGDLPGVINISPRQSQDAPNKAMDNVYLDWIDIEYPIQLNAVEDIFEGYIREDMVTSKTTTARLDGFSSPDVVVYDKGNHLIMDYQSTRESPDMYSITFPIVLNNKTDIYVCGTRHIKSPKGIKRVSNINLVEAFREKELALIVYDDFTEPAERLRQWKEKKGISTGIAVISDVYDQFNFGLKHPVALKNFLTELWGLPERRIKYVLLIGAASGDHKNLFGGARRDLVPTYYYTQPGCIPYADDNRFAVLENKEGQPDIAIGRLPVESAEECAHVIEKIMEYEQELLTTGTEPIRALFIASYEGDIRDNSDKVAEVFRDEFPGAEILKTYASETDLYRDDNAQKIMNYFNSGLWLIFFTGHGGNNVWEAGPTSLKAKNLFDLNHIDALTNKGRYPIIFTATCYSAAFDIPAEVQSIGMKLINKKDAGAIALFGTPDRSSMMLNLQFMHTMIKYLSEPGCATLGEAFVKTKREINISDVSASIVLLGDPTLSLKKLKHK